MKNQEEYFHEIVESYHNGNKEYFFQEYMHMSFFGKTDFVLFLEDTRLLKLLLLKQIEND